MIHGESYKPIVAEAAKKSADNVYQSYLRHSPVDGRSQGEPRRWCGWLQRANRKLPRLQSPRPSSSRAGGASNIYKPRSVGERALVVSGMHLGHRVLPMVLLISAGAKMTQMENRIVLARFKDGYGPVGAYFLAPQDVHAERPRRRVRIQVVAVTAGNRG